MLGHPKADTTGGPECILLASDLLGTSGRGRKASGETELRMGPSLRHEHRSQRVRNCLRVCRYSQVLPDHTQSRLLGFREEAYFNAPVRRERVTLARESVWKFLQRERQAGSSGTRTSPRPRGFLSGTGGIANTSPDSPRWQVVCLLQAAWATGPSPAASPSSACGARMALSPHPDFQADWITSRWPGTHGSHFRSKSSHVSQ